MSHPFGDLLSQFLHRKHGLSQSKLAEGILQDPSVITKMCKGQRLTGSGARARVLAIASWLHTHAAIETLLEADALLAAAGMAPLRASQPEEQALLQTLQPPPPAAPALAARAPLTARWTVPLTAPTSFVGREAELAQLAALLANPACRLITLLGPGGIGKTRLALQAAAVNSPLFADGAVFVPLAPLSSAEGIVPAIAGALGFSFSGAEASAAQLLRYLRQSELLLILDNFEHLPDGAGLVLEILRQAPRVTLLITTHQRLRLQAEWICDVAGLPAPPAEQLDGLEGFAAVALFIERAAQARAGFTLTRADAAAVAHICRLVAGLPLGIELAAAWTRWQACPEIARAIEQNLDVLTSVLRDLPERHQSLRAVFNYSWKLLAVEEQSVLSQLTVFRGGFSSEAAAQVAGATPSQLRALADRSLVRRGPAERYELHEVVRQYAAEQLAAAGQVEAAAERHPNYFLALALRLQPEHAGPAARLYFQGLAADHDNFTAALERCRLRGCLPQWLWLAAALALYWESSGRVAEGLFWLEAGLDQADTGDQAGGDGDGPLLGRHWGTACSARAQALIWAAILRHRYGDLDRAAAHGRLALQLCLNNGDEWGAAAAQHILARVLRDQGHFSQALAMAEPSLQHYRAGEDREGIALVLGTQAVVHMFAGRPAQAQPLLEASLALCREQGNAWGGAFQLEILGGVALHQGHPARAQALYEESLRLFQELGYKPGQADVLMDMGFARRSQDDLAGARQHFEACLALRRLMGNVRETTGMLAALEEVALAQGDQPAAQSFAAERQRWLATEAGAIRS